MEEVFKAGDEIVKQLRAELAKAEERIATLESKLREREATISRLLADDLLSSEELTELKELVWQLHRDLPQGCECNICTEVERSRTELGGGI